jgi:nucleoside-diphosphate-sugar epimerase
MIDSLHEHPAIRFEEAIMAVLITGGCGHIGSWTAYHLAAEGEEVILADLRSALPAHLQEVSGRITLEPCDVTSLADLLDCLRRHEGEIGTIIHTVAVMGEFVQDHPHRNVSLNVNGFLNVLEAARLRGIGRVLYTSTGAVYGALEGIASEAEHPPEPADLYGATKTSAEYLGLQYGASFGLDVRIARVYFVYGPGKLPSTFIRLFRNTFGALEGLQGLEMERGREQELDFTYVEDVARGLVLLCRKEDPAYRIYNIATGTPHSVGETADLCARLSPYGVSARIGPGRMMPRCSALDISRAGKDLGFTPQTGFEEGVRRYRDWIKEVLERG